MKARRDVFQAIADPTRREILGLLAAQTLTLNGIAENFQISQPAISKHMRILTECGLVSITPNGREKLCEAKLDQLNEVTGWVEQSKKLWNHRFEKLDHYLVELQTKNQNDGIK
uniref:ArsR/SmtB family transcription factor n=1 Tax=Pedobacter schmidteae TaxID=2201271 RepID=UPI000EB51F3D|nr:metalloregulator ArsR/SmtB family transcription factor [Pedobacter schmidteae]